MTGHYKHCLLVTSAHLPPLITGQVLCAPPLLEVTVPLGQLVSQTLELVSVSGAQCEILLITHCLALLTHIVLSEGFAPHKSVTAGEAAPLLDLLPPLGQSHWRRHDSSEHCS